MLSEARRDRGSTGADRGSSTASASERPAAPRRKNRRGGGRGVHRRDVILLANQMAVMLDTGVPLGETLRSVTSQSLDPAFGEVLQSVTDDVEAGEPLSKAMEKHPKAFPSIMTALLRASEASGTMSSMLNRIAQYLTKDHQIVRQVRGALMYPTFMFLLCVSITIFLLTYILPRFTAIYEGKDAKLPAPTRFLMALSEGLVDQWAVYLVALAFTVLAAGSWLRTRPGRGQLDWLKLHTPVLANLFNKLYLSRACRTLGTMMETGVPLLDAIGIVKEVTHNVHYDRLWDQIDDDLRRGQPLSDALLESPLVPDYLAQMIESGERTGRLGDVFSRVADFCESEFDIAVKTTTQFIEPVMIVVMGGIIGFVAIALLIPIFSVARITTGG